MVGNNVDHVFEPEQAEPIMDYFAKDECAMPTVELYRDEPWKLKWSVSYTHYPPKTGIKIQPSSMKFRQEVNVYFLSPFKIVSLEKQYGSGYPFASNFHYVQCWEYELVPARGTSFMKDMQLNQLNSVCV